MEGETSAAWKKPVINVAAICGSLRRASFNRGLVRSAIEICDGEPIEGMRIELIDISSLPFLNTDLEVGGEYPPAVEAFRGKIREADAILFASPEYNYSLSVPDRIWNLFIFKKGISSLEHIMADEMLWLVIPINHWMLVLNGPLKNAIDWASRPPNCWADKAAAIISAGGNFGGGRAQYHLRQVGVYLDLHFINKPELFVYAFQPPEKFDSDGNLIDRETKERLKKILLSLLAFTRRLQGRSEDSGSG